VTRAQAEDLFAPRVVTTSDPLVAFAYQLVQDRGARWATALFDAVASYRSGGKFTLGDEHLAAFAESLAAKLRHPEGP
jgi:hypothetical protein